MLTELNLDKFETICFPAIEPRGMTSLFHKKRRKFSFSLFKEKCEGR